MQTRFAQEQGFSIEKISALISIVKANHEAATGPSLLTVIAREKSVHLRNNDSKTKNLISPPSARHIVELSLYYKHFKLYQYAFTPTYILDLEAVTEADLNLVELPPTIPSLAEAKTQEERDEELLNLQRELEELHKKLRDSEVLAHDAAIAASIEAAYRASIPEEVTQAAEEAVTKHMEQMRADIEEKLQATEEKISGKFLNSNLGDLKASNDKEKPAGKDDKKAAGKDDKKSGKDSSDKKPTGKDVKKPGKGK